MCVMRTCVCVCVYKRVDVCLFFSFFFIYLQMSRHTTAAAEFPGKSEHIQKERESGRAGARGGYK